MTLLKVTDVTKRFGGVVANRDIDLAIEEGEIVGLIGPNGAGKTTLFNCIAGFYSPDDGRIWFEGQEIQGHSPDRVCQGGIARTFQITKLLKGTTTLDNVIVGALLRTKNVREARELALSELNFAGLANKMLDPVECLTIAEQKRLELTRALATKPRLLLLDEVMAGLTPAEQKEAVSLIRRIRDRGITILLVEHVMEVVMPISDRVVVLNQGKKIAEGVPRQIVQNPVVIKAYLGERYNAGSSTD